MIGFYIFTAAIVTFVLIAILHNLRQEKKYQKEKDFLKVKFKTKARELQMLIKKSKMKFC